MLKHSRILVAAAAILALPAVASAADLPQIANEPAVAYTPVPTVYDWSGVYVGVHGGYGWGDADTTLAAPLNSFSADGFLGGVQAGYNFQYGNFVAGVELDASYTDIKGNVAGAAEAELNWLGTARLRAGYAFDRFMVYGTGGLAYGDVEVTNVPAGVSESNGHIGWALGAGAEAAVTDNVTVRGEYLYVNLQDEDYTNVLGAGNKAGLDAHTVKVGLNYKF